MLLRVPVAAMAFAVVASLAPRASAATITIENDMSLPRLDASGAQLQKRPLPLTPEGINFVDCLAEQKIRFPLRLDGMEPDGSLEAWIAIAGTDCADPALRSGAFARCQRFSEPLPLQSAVSVDVPVRAILAAGPRTLVEDELCGNVDRWDLEVQFLYFSPGNPTTPSATAKVLVPVDTIGPEPPSPLAASPGDGKAVVSWRPLDAAASGLTGVAVYCAPADDSEESGACRSAALAAGSVPREGSEHLCGTVMGNTATSVQAASVPNGVAYAFALAGSDVFGNVGTLSSPVCATPAAARGEDADDGEGGCSAAPGSSRHPASPIGLGLFAIPALGLLLARRGRRLSAGARDGS